MMKILKILIIGASLTAIILLIPDLIIPITTVLDSVMGSDLTSVLNSVYDILPDQLMTLMILQLSTLTITIAIRFLVGGTSSGKK